MKPGVLAVLCCLVFALAAGQGWASPGVRRLERCMVADRTLYADLQGYCPGAASVMLFPSRSFAAFLLEEGYEQGELLSSGWLGLVPEDLDPTLWSGLFEQLSRFLEEQLGPDAQLALSLSGSQPRDPSGGFTAVSCIDRTLLVAALKKLEIQGSAMIRLEFSFEGGERIALYQLRFMDIQESQSALDPRVKPGDYVPVVFKRRGVQIRFRGRVEELEDDGRIRLRPATALFQGPRGSKRFLAIPGEDGDYLVP